MMINLKMLIDSLKKRKLSNIAIIVQFTITFFALIISIGLITDIVNKVHIARKLVKPTSYIVNYDNNNAIAKKEFYDSLKNDKNINSYGYYFYERESINYLNVSTGILNVFSFKTKKGRCLNKEDFKEKNEIPVLVTADLKEKYHINSIIEREYYNKIIKYKVVGILDSSFRFWCKSDKLVDKSKNTIICPSNLDDYNIIAINTVIDLKNAKKVNTIEQNYKKFFNSSTYNENNKSKNTVKNEKVIINLRKYVLSVINEKLEAVVYITIFSIAILVLSVSGLIINLNLLLTKRLKEFGIRLSLGATIKDISKLLAMELLADFIIAFIIATLPIPLINVYLPNSGGILINLWSIVIVAVLLFIFIFFIFKNVLRELKKYEPVRLVRGVL